MTRLLLILIAVSGGVRLAIALQGSAGIALRARLAATVAYAGLLIVLFLPRSGTRTRVWMLATFTFVLGAFQLARSGLAGDGRLTLVTLPLFVLAMAGVRSGWIAMGISGVIYAAISVAMDHGAFAPSMVIRDNPTSLRTWGILGVCAAAHAVLLAAIITGLLSIYRSSLRTEHETAEKLRDEAERRKAAYHALARESDERQRLEAALLNAGEEERRLMGAEVHDGLCQQLTAAILHCAVAERRGESEHARAVDDIKVVRRLLGDCIAGADSLVHRLAPLQMSGEDLSRALSGLAEQTRRAAGVCCDYRERGDVRRVNPQAGAHLYRIAQEAVRNAMRHSQADGITIELYQDAGLIRLSVMDNGIGVADAMRTDSPGMGMRTMRYRASLIGAELTLSDRGEGGTAVCCVLPLTEVSSAAPPVAPAGETGVSVLA